MAERCQPKGEEINARKGEDNYELQFGANQTGFNSLLAHFHTTLSQERSHANRVNQIAEQALQNAVNNAQVNMGNNSAHTHAINQQSHLDAQSQNAMSRHHQNIMADQYTTTSPWEARGEATANRQHAASDTNMAFRYGTSTELMDALKPVLVAAVAEGVRAASQKQE